MRNIITVIGILLLASNINAQQLLGIYKNGPVKLVPDKEFAKTNDWNIVFETYNDTMYNKHIGKRKSLLVLPDGSFLVNHAYRNFFTKFDPDGTFEKEFSIKNSSGKVMKTPGIIGVLNKEIYYTGVTNTGKMYCADLDGNFIKTLTLDYMTKQIIPLPGKKLAVVGWVIWSDRFRDFVSIIDYETNEDKIIWDHFTPRSGGFNTDKKFTYGYKYKKGGAFSFKTMPHINNLGLRPSPKVSFVNNKLIIAIPPTGEIHEYDINGKLLTKKNVSWKPGEINPEEQMEIQKKAIEGYTNNIKSYESKSSKTEREIERIEALKTIVKKMEKDLSEIEDPIQLPFFSTIIKDSDGNLLFFEYPEEKGANKFSVYTYNSVGEFVCQSSFVCEDYDLVINTGKLVFYKGYLHGLQELKETDGVPMRLVKFKLEN